MFHVFCHSIFLSQYLLHHHVRCTDQCLTIRFDNDSAQFSFIKQFQGRSDLVIPYLKLQGINDVTQVGNMNEGLIKTGILA